MSSSLPTTVSTQPVYGLPYRADPPPGFTNFVKAITGNVFTASDYYAAGWEASKCADGVLDDSHSWATHGSLSGGWWQCTFSRPTRIARVRTAARLTGSAYGAVHLLFSDGSTAVFGDTGNTSWAWSDHTFKSRVVTWFRIVQDSGGSGLCGLAEVEAY